MKYLEEVSIVAEACQNAFKATKMNIELLGNGDPHVHFHIFPRRKGDINIPGPVWWLPKEELFDESNKPTKTELSNMVDLLKTELIRLLKSYNSVHE